MLIKWIVLQSHRVSGELWRVVVDVCDADHCSSRVRQTVCGVSLHVSCLDHQSVLSHFLQKKDRKLFKQQNCDQIKMGVCCTAVTEVEKDKPVQRMLTT